MLFELLIKPRAFFFPLLQIWAADLKTKQTKNHGNSLVVYWLSGKESACSVQETLEIWVQSLGGKDPLEKMATHSSILAWKIPQAEEPGRLLPMGSQELDTT